MKRLNKVTKDFLLLIVGSAALLAVFYAEAGTTQTSSEEAGIVKTQPIEDNSAGTKEEMEKPESSSEAIDWSSIDDSATSSDDE